MCLFTTTNIPFIAEKDIVCYKILDTDELIGIYVTPYQRTKVDINSVFIAEGPKTIKTFDGRWFEISEGFIHSYLKLKNIIALYKTEQIFKCIIPKGTHYFISNLDGSCCSEQIIFKRKMYRFLGRWW